MSQLRPVRRALISVSDKSGIVEFATTLNQLGVELLSTGGTYRLLKDNNLPVTEVSEYTGFPEMMDGRVKTLHPKVHGGILARRGKDDDVLEQHQINPIDMVVVNLYPFQETVAKPDVTLPHAIENIDIGGPTMLRSAAKNFNDVTVITNASDYARICDELTNNQGQTLESTRFDLACKAFEHTAQYDGAIANFLGTKLTEQDAVFPRTFNNQYTQKEVLRYGENSHQRSAFYTEIAPATGTIAAAKQLSGKALSYNNIADTDAALEAVSLFDEPTCVIVKHANPCGIASASNIKTAYKHAFATDPESAFGGIIAFNRELDAETAALICEKQFVEVIIAPTASEAAAEVVAQKKNVRLLACGDIQPPQAQFDIKKVGGGLLVQDKDITLANVSELKVVTKRQPTDAELSDLMFAYKVAKMVKSNAIVYAANKQTVGVGAGQMSRVNSARIAAIKAEHAGLEVKGAVMASDAFFPFRDGIDNAAEAGISCIIQPGGSIRDQEVIDAADEHGIAMVFSDIRHFRH